MFFLKYGVRLGEILDLEAEKQENEQRKMAPESLAGDIKFEHVNFRYGTRQRVLEDIDFTIKKGEKIAFVGESGSGKTTLSKLLLHLYQVESGNILINDNKHFFAVLISTNGKSLFISPVILFICFKYTFSLYLPSPFTPYISNPNS